jgi:ACT domain-containing protein
MSDKAIQTRIEKNKELIIERLKTLPVVQVACQRVGIGRATYYRWRKEDKEFALKAGGALLNGRLFVNDMAESQLLSQIKDQNMTAIIFWLKHNHPIYGNRLEIMTDSKKQENLSPQEIEMVKKALTLGSLIEKPAKEKNDRHKKHSTSDRNNQ